jgi:DUF971 family protein
MVAHRSNQTPGLSPNTPRPTDITVHSASHALEIAFDDGRRFRFPFEFLRVFSPSAEVRGHGPGQERLQVGKRAVTIRSVDSVGHYAIQPIFSDGHDTGLYSWDYLYELGIHQDAMWEDYLRRLADAGASRDASDEPAPAAGAGPGCGGGAVVGAGNGAEPAPGAPAAPGVRAIRRDPGAGSR